MSAFKLATATSSPLLSPTHIFPSPIPAATLRSSLLALGSPTSHHSSPSGAGASNHSVTSYFPDIAPFHPTSSSLAYIHQPRGRSVSHKIIASSAACLINGETGTGALKRARGRTATVSFGSLMSQLSTAGTSSPSLPNLAAAAATPTGRPAAAFNLRLPTGKIAPTPLSTPTQDLPFKAAPTANSLTPGLETLSLSSFPPTLPVHTDRAGPSPLRPKLPSRAVPFTPDMKAKTSTPANAINPSPLSSFATLPSTHTTLIEHTPAVISAPTPLPSPSPLSQTQSTSTLTIDPLRFDPFSHTITTLLPRAYAPPFSPNVVSFNLIPSLFGESEKLASPSGSPAQEEKVEEEQEKDTRNAFREPTPANRGFVMERDGSWLGSGLMFL